MSAPRIEMHRVASRISAVRAAVEASDDPDIAIVVAMIGPPGEIPDDVPYPTELRDLFRVVNGMRCGGVAISGSVDVLYTENSSLIEGGAERWLCVGWISDVPVFLERSNGTIWHAMEASSEDFMDLPMTQIAPDVWSFVGWYAMGPGYLELYSDEDGDLVTFLRQCGFFEWEGQSARQPTGQG